MPRNANTHESARKNQTNERNGWGNAMNAFGNLRFHWQEYLVEAGELALYMFSRCAIATLLLHPASPVRHLIANGFFRRTVMGLGMGATVVVIVVSPWGKSSTKTALAK
jgi:aquaporin Z